MICLVDCYVCVSFSFSISLSIHPSLHPLRPSENSIFQLIGDRYCNGVLFHTTNDLFPPFPTFSHLFSPFLFPFGGFSIETISSTKFVNITVNYVVYILNNFTFSSSWRVFSSKLLTTGNNFYSKSVKH